MTASPDFAHFLTRHREPIVARFVLALQRTELAPAGVPHPLLVDHIPRFLDEMTTEIARVRSINVRDEIDSTNATAREHGEQRWSLGYDLEALIQEYGVLRHCILEVAKAEGIQVSLDEFDVLAKCLSVGVEQATTAYIKHRDVELNAQRAQLEFLAEAGRLLSSSLDYRSTLRSLAGLLVPRLADWCAVHLEGTSVDDMLITHVDPAKVEVLREIYRTSVKESPGGHAHVVKTGDSVFVPAIEPGFLDTVATSKEQLALLKTIHSTSWIVVPLRVQGNVFGALTLAYSESAQRYDERALTLLREVAGRAAVAIDNARLYELSQNERSRAEAAARAKDEFVAMVSHELRTPLNAILGWMALIRKGLPEAKLQHALDVIERNGKAQSQLVGDLLDISRILTGSIRINPSQVELSNVVEMAVEGLRPAAEAKRIHIAIDVDRASSVMRGDGERLQQVVWNLLVNALKFTPKGGRINVAVKRVESDLELTVQDNGAGISPEFLPHVFESFRQSDGSSTRAHGGLGIGLSIAKHIVELHGGAIEAQSEGTGRGSTFTVRLPISPLVSTTKGVTRIPATSEPTSSTVLPSSLEHVRVLVVDDEPDARELVAYVLEASGMEVRVAESARAALKELETFVPDVIVSDIGMPEEDGYSLIRRIRTLADAREKIPAVALTAFARNEDRTRALVDGFNLYMAKPVEPMKLVNAVMELASATNVGTPTPPPPGADKGS